MNSLPKKSITPDLRRIRCAHSLAKAVQDSDGTISMNTLKMSVEEFIAEVAGPNNIMFCYAKPPFPPDIQDDKKEDL